MPKLSVVVPVYNVLDYLEKCVASVQAQTLEDWELLLVDDGSTDGCGALCDRLAGEDPRVRAIHQENQGLGGARNTGIAAAQGEFLLLLDSDDWLAPEIAAHAVAAAERCGADMVLFGLRTEAEAGGPSREARESLPQGEAMTLAGRPDLLLTLPSAANKLYRRALFERTGARYPSRVWYEDLRTTPKLLAEARSVVYLDEIGYHYLQRAGSIMRGRDVARNGEILDAMDDLLAWFEEKGLSEKFWDELEYLALYHAYLMASARVIRLDRRDPLLGRLAAYVGERFPRYRENPYRARLTRNEKLLFSLLEKRQYALIGLLFKIKG